MLTLVLRMEMDACWRIARQVFAISWCSVIVYSEVVGFWWAMSWTFMNNEQHPAGSQHWGQREWRRCCVQLSGDAFPHRTSTSRCSRSWLDHNFRRLSSTDVIRCQFPIWPYPAIHSCVSLTRWCQSCPGITGILDRILRHWHSPSVDAWQLLWYPWHVHHQNTICLETSWNYVPDLHRLAMTLWLFIMFIRPSRISVLLSCGLCGLPRIQSLASACMATWM